VDQGGRGTKTIRNRPMIDPITSLAFSVSENRGVFALLVGSGISRSAFIPTGWEITLDLIRRVAQAEGVKDQTNWEAWYRAREKKDPNYSDLLDALSTTAEERRSILHSYIEPTPKERLQGHKVPTQAHRSIAKLVVDGFTKVIVTTNFDRLIENSLREAGIEPTVVSNEDSARGAVPLAHNQCFVLKVHGDYLDTRILNTEFELSKYSPVIEGLLDRIFDEYGLIACGWSGGWDTALVAAINRTSSRRYPMVWATRHQPSQTAQDIVSHRGGRFITIGDANSFFDQLSTRVVTLIETRRQNPASIELLAQAAKQFVAKSEYRVNLHDLLLQELKRAIELRDVPDLATDGAFDAGEMNRRVERYDTLSEPLIRILGILGRHGDGSEFQIVTDIIQMLAKVPSRGGITLWIDLHQKYPPMLALFAHGLGALKAERYKSIFDLLSIKIPREYDSPLSAVEMLFLYPLFGSTTGNWKWLKGLEKARTPVSEHLLSRFSEWAVDYSFGNKDFELIFERFELLGALAFMSVNYTVQEIDEASTRPPPSNFVWAPMGRIRWHERVRSALLVEAAQSPLRDQLLLAGFCRKDPQHLDASLKNLVRFGAVSRFDDYG
jgi:hypothetical protein